MDAHDSLRQFLEAAPDAMVVVDREGRIQLVNGQTEGLFGYRRDELVGEAVEVLVPQTLRRKHAVQRKQYQQDPHRRPMGTGLELAGRRKDGSWFPVEISLNPVTIDSGTWITAAVRDITHRARVEKALKLTNQELEAFTYSVSHDLRAPIRQIDGFARLLEEQFGDELEPRAQHYLGRIQEGAQRMGRLVDSLLQLARLGRQDLQLVRVPLDTVVEDVIKLLPQERHPEEIDWRIGPLPTVVCDAELIRVVFSNLLSNAVKYSRPRRPAVVQVESAETMPGMPVITVRDNGVGFDMRYADKLFGVFQRLHSAEEFEGTGVGLATVQRIVHKHGGDIWVDARPGGGAAFHFTLQSVQAAEDQ